ncbi:MAG: VWA domain-containing protein [Gammaproteobacteria bacterium]|nr:VWA domain-containing protein [Gammaproteobacteria bacterium]
MNETIEVRWQGPDLPGDYIGFVDSATGKATRQYVYVGNTKGGVARITSPSVPGRYELAYFSKREILARVPIEIKAVTARLQAPSSADINARITVQVDGPNNAGDLIQVMTLDGEPVRGRYAYVGNHADGNVPLRMPEAAGEYRIGYLTAQVLIGSTSITVGTVAATLNAPDSVAAGSRFEVAWQGPNNPGDKLVLLDSAGEQTKSYAYVGNRPEVATLRAPESPGGYEIVYLTGNQVIGRAPVTVNDVFASLQSESSVLAGHRLAIGWEGPGNAGDIIRFIEPSSGESASYGYVGNSDGQILRVTAPLDAGNYRLEYTTAGGRTLATRPVEVVPAPVAPGRLRVLPSANLRLSDRDAIEVILDASGSMLQRHEGQRRIDIARRTLTELVRNTIPDGTGFALRVFGHREAGSCRTDLEIPHAPLDAAAVSEVVAGVQARNLAKTPIAASLARTEQDLEQVAGERIVVLLTDGEETCDGDPAEAITRLRELGVDIRVNIIGFAIDDSKLAETFSRWAHLGGGTYLAADSEGELASALGTSVNPRFQVVDASGARVVDAVAGSGDVWLPPGDYVVTAAGRSYRTKVTSDDLTTVTLE